MHFLEWKCFACNALYNYKKKNEQVRYDNDFKVLCYINGYL